MVGAWSEKRGRKTKLRPKALCQEGFRACAKTFLPVTELEPSWHVPERTGGAGDRVGFDTLSAGRQEGLASTVRSVPRVCRDYYTTTGIKKLPQELNLIPVVVVIPKALPSGITTTIGIKL